MGEVQEVDRDAVAALRLIGPDPANWVPERPGIDHNVIIVGGGQSGCAFAFALRRAGVGPGDRVAFLTPNVPALLAAHFAVLQVHAALVAINTRLAAEEVGYGEVETARFEIP